MKCGTILCNNILEFISVIVLLISYILFLVQACINYRFLKDKTREITAEKLLYEHFSEDIYDNIKRFPFSEINKADPMSFGSFTNLSLEVKLDAYFDCRGIKNGLLHEECHDKIIKNLTCCKSECCWNNKRGLSMKEEKNGDFEIEYEINCNNYNFDLRRAHLDNSIIVYNHDELLDDPRRRFCTYYNKYIGDTSTIMNSSFQTKLYEYDYEQLLDNQNTNDTFYVGSESASSLGFIDCGELDTLKHHLFVKDKECPINNVVRSNDNVFFSSAGSSSLIFVRNILSEIPPSIHEWKEALKSNKTIITIKDINEVIKENNEYYKRQSAYFYIDELDDIYYKNQNEVNNNQKLYWYSTNYIGFKDKKELGNFKLIFNESDNTDNPLYKIRNEIDPGITITSIVIATILILCCCVYIVLFFIKKKLKIYFIIKDVMCLAAFIAGLVIYINFTQKFKHIDIEIDEHYKKILNLYNKRRKLGYFLASIIIISFVFVFEIYFLFCAEKNRAPILDETSSNQTEDKKIENAEIQTRNEKRKIGNIEDVEVQITNTDRNLKVSKNDKVIKPLKVSVHAKDDKIN